MARLRIVFDAEVTERFLAMMETDVSPEEFVGGNLALTDEGDSLRAGDGLEIIEVRVRD